MEGRGVERHVRVSPTKVRQVVDLIRGQPVERALDILHFSPKRASLYVEKAVRSAMASAVGEEQIGTVEAEALIIHRAYVDQGPTLKRIRPRARGAADRIRKRTSHITIVVSDSEQP